MGLGFMYERNFEILNDGVVQKKNERWTKDLYRSEKRKKTIDIFEKHKIHFFKRLKKTSEMCRS